MWSALIEASCVDLCMWPELLKWLNERLQDSSVLVVKAALQTLNTMVT